MFTYKGLNENFQFLVIEIKKQLELTISALEKIDDIDYYIERITSSGDYVDNLKNIIARKSYSQILNSNSEEKTLIDNMMAVNTIASNLEKIGDYSENIVKQLAYFNNEHFIKDYAYMDYFALLLESLDLVPESLFRGDLQAALTICRSEYKIDQLFKRDFDLLMSLLEKGDGNQGDIVTAMNIFRYGERAGDALLNTGEAIISSVLGTRIKINQYIALTETLDSDNQDDFILETIGMETRSGCRIEKVKSKTVSDEWHEVIFKEGKMKKLLEEKENLEKWGGHFPELVPRIFGFEEHGDNATLLLEFLRGKNFQEVIVSGDDQLVESALVRVLETVDDIWTRTRKDQECSAGFMNQLEKRLFDVFNVHPYFHEETKFIGPMKKPAFESLLAEVKSIEPELKAPFSVMIHGDFNNDNIIYDSHLDRVYYIDIHRSDYQDYAQDASVFLVSNFRLPIVDSTPRLIINNVIERFFTYTLDFAERSGDNTFQARLALGLIRSFITSTRFALRKEFAKAMFYRAVYLMEQLIQHSGKPWNTFVLSMDVVRY